MGISPLSSSGSPVAQIQTNSAVPNLSTNTVPTPAPPAASSTPSAGAPAVAPAPPTVKPVPAPGSGKTHAPERPIVDPSKIGPEFKWNDTAHRLVVVMMDRSDGTVVQQLPPQQVLDLLQEAIEHTRHELGDKAGAKE